jgi:hydroxymethylpyrimidine kinase/phosphomethylpyrimidine kinase/thiamine-phosphate diphosphorylase
MVLAIMYNLFFVAFLLIGLCSVGSSSLSSNLYDTTTTTTTSFASTRRNQNHVLTTPLSPQPPVAVVPPIVYSIAGSDSGGGAGVQADLHAIHAMNCHGCSVITCLTAQNSMGVTAVHVPPITFLRQQLETLLDDLPPFAIKIGMLGTADVAQVVGEVLKEKLQDYNHKVWIVLDPVMISTSGSKLLDDDAVDAMIQHVFPLADVVTPNKFEAEALLNRRLLSPKDVEEGAQDLLKLGCRSVLIKGGHSFLEDSSSSTHGGDGERTSSTSSVVQSILEYAQDFLLSSDATPTQGEERLCDASRGVWLRSKRWESDNTHGTGCTLSSAMASALALGEQNRMISGTDQQTKVGAICAIDLVDACCLAKAYVSAGIQKGVQFGSGPGPVAHTTFPAMWENFPTIAIDPTAASSNRESDASTFSQMKSYSSYLPDTNYDGSTKLGRILPIVDTVEWVQRLASIEGVTDIQLRIKDETNPVKILERIKICQDHCQRKQVRLWINDHWEAAIEAGCFGVHVGQEDLVKCSNAGGLDLLRSKKMAFGISTHSFGELAVALGIEPTYISMGPVFPTSSKKVQFYPQGLDTVRKWRELIPPSIPFVTIGGINDVMSTEANRAAGADCVAVISAITKSPDDPSKSVTDLNNAMLVKNKSRI